MNATPRAGRVNPPARGIFPLDHRAECRESMRVYLGCLARAAHGDAGSRTVAADHTECRDLSKDYLACRMAHGLMAREDLDTLGFAADAAPAPAPAAAAPPPPAPAGNGEIIMGLGAARRAKMGVLFGLGSSDANRKGAAH